MDRRVRTLLLVIAVLQAVLAVLWVLQVPFVINLWPFPGRSPLTNFLIGSFLLAAAASIGCCLYVRSDRALAGVALDYIAVFAPVAVLSFGRVVAGAGTDVAVFGLVCVAIALAGLRLLRWSLRHPWRDPRPLPALVRWSFAVFVIALGIGGGLLIIQVPNTLPWEITPDLSLLFGCMFLGAAAYFVFALADPRWENAHGQLAGFLAYDVVLIVPFITRLPTVEDKFRVSLIVYVAILSVSAALAVYYLFLHPGTRLWPRPSERDATSAPRLQPGGETVTVTTHRDAP